MTKNQVVRVVLVFALVVGWTYWLPLIVAGMSGAFTAKDIQSRARSVYPECEVFLNEQEAIISNLRQLERKIAFPGSGEDLAKDLERYTELKRFQKEHSNKLHFAKYANSQARDYFFTSYTALSILLVLLVWRIGPEEKISHFRSIQLGVGLYVFFQWSNWFRATSWGQVDRKLFSYAHFDISKAGFFMQELHVLGMMILCGYIAHRFFRSAFTLQSRKFSAAELSRTTKREFENWQLCSVLLAVAFLPWTVFFWHAVTSLGETRYFPSAIGIHIIWAFIWIVASVPLVRASHEWHELLVKCISDQSCEKLDKLEKIEPFSRGMFAASAVASAVSFAYPLLQSFF